MLKFLLTLAVVVVALMLWFGKGRGGGSVRRPRAQAQPPAAPPQPMLSCVRCGLHLPRGEAFLDDSGRPYCGAEHRRLGPGSGPTR